MAICASSAIHLVEHSSTPPSPLCRALTPFQSVAALPLASTSPILVPFDLPLSSSLASPPPSPGRKMFICTGYGNCTMAFSRSEHLARHIRKHTGERPFKCHCGRDFSRLDNLRQHAQTVHADQQEANQAMMSRLQAVHNQLSAQSSTKKRKAASTTPPGQKSSLAVSHGPTKGLPLLPPAPINLANFAPQASSSTPNYVASPRQHPGLSDPYFSYGDHFAPPSSPYMGQHAYSIYPTQVDVDADSRAPLPSIAAMVPRQMPQAAPTSSPYLASPITTTSTIFSGHPASVFHHTEPRSPMIVTSRPMAYVPSPAPYQASVLQPYSAAQAELYDPEATMPLQHSPALSYVHTPAPPPLASPAMHYTHTPVVHSRSFDGASDDGKPGPPEPHLTHSVDGASSSYPSPSTPSPSSLQQSSSVIKGLGDLMPPEFYSTHSSLAQPDLSGHGPPLARPPSVSRHRDEHQHYYSVSPALTHAALPPKGHHHSHSVPPSVTYGGFVAPMSPIPSGSLKRSRDDADGLIQYPDGRSKRQMVTSL